MSKHREILFKEMGILNDIRIGDVVIGTRGTISKVEHERLGTLELNIAGNNTFLIGTKDELISYRSCDIDLKGIKHISRTKMEDNDSYLRRVLRTWMGFFPREVRDVYEEMWGRHEDK